MFALILGQNLNAQVLTSSTVSDIVKKVTSINNGQLTRSNVPMCINALVDTNEKNKLSTNVLYNKCAVDLCGLPGKNPSVFISDDSYAKYLSKSNYKKIDKEIPLIEKVVDKNLNAKKIEIGQIKKFLENPQQLYLKMDASDKQKINQRVFSSFIKTEFVKANDIKDRIKVNIIPPVWADDNFKKALHTYGKNFQLAQAYDIDTIKGLQLTESELKTHSLDLISKMEDQLKINPKFLEEEDVESLNDFKAVTKKDSTTSALLMRNLTTLIRFQSLMLKKSSAINGGTLCDTQECEGARAKFLNQSMVHQSLEKMENSLNGPQFRTQSINRCKAGLISADIEAADKKKTRAIYQEALKLIRSNYVSKFSAHSKGMLEKYLSKSIVTKAEALDNSAQKENNVDAFKIKAQSYIQIPAQNLNDSLVVKAAFELINDPNGLDTISSIQPCNNYANNVWDSFLSAKKVEMVMGDSEMLKGKDHIFISPFTCQHSSHGKQVLAHEMGHALNSFFQYNTLSESSAKNFKDLRECAKDQYTIFQFPLIPELGFPGDSLLTEEDHADLISYMTINDKNLYTCSFLGPSITDNNSYINLDFKNIPFDSHSNSFSRVIFEAINKNIPLPQSCNDLIEEVKPEMRLKKCI